ncbi:hypothetical protein [Bartonella doshiae]|uniref:Uncharacterized protein n=2 Tax=Bartonella doshiae TaxID=33044 RepID=A0A380ZBB5_BARDO|nr:hypothetical protein [Bartonella doshiae]EJF79716.1 hypothetical protein MCS_01443 [Bartonella doshiae NCTC 12862 = ATCC 700133]MBB6159693.1 hypothetical protein [Bartonella doshiae]SUV44273.1 Uncharacterised protein [Bartonella doshiae]
MKKISTQILLATNILICSSFAFAGFGEKKWVFSPGESITIAPSDTIHQGVEYACNTFKPKKVSFTLSYSSPADLNKLKIVADDHNKITHDKENKIFTIEDVKSLHLSLPSWGHYTFKNLMKKKIIGIECDTGDYD